MGKRYSERRPEKVKRVRRKWVGWGRGDKRPRGTTGGREYISISEA